MKVPDMRVNVTWNDLPFNLENARQVAAIVTAFTLPLTTTAQNIAVAVFMVLTLITLDVARFRATLRSAAGYLPVALFALILIGVLWSVQPYGVAIRWITPYAKLLLIPLVIATAFTPRQALQIGCGFLAGCVVVLAFSLASFLWPSGPWHWFKSPGIPVKDNAVQSGCFALCAFGLAIGTVDQAPSRRPDGRWANRAARSRRPPGQPAPDSRSQRDAVVRSPCLPCRAVVGTRAARECCGETVAAQHVIGDILHGPAVAN